MEDPATYAMDNTPVVEQPPDFGPYSGEPFFLTDAHVLFCCVIMMSAVLVPIVGSLLTAVARALSRRVCIRCLRHDSAVKRHCRSFL